MPAPDATTIRGRWLAGAGLLFIAVMTLQPMPELTPLVARTPPWCLVCGNLGLMDVLLNVLLFVPYGAGLRLAGLSRRRVLLAALATTLAVETLQYTVIPGRDASLSDLLTNTTGGLLGASLVAALPRLRRPSRALARMLLAAWAALWLGQLAVVAWSEGRTLPATVYYGQWAADLAGYAQFRGRIGSAELGGIAIPPERLGADTSAAIRARLLAPAARLHVRTVPAGPVHRLAPVVSVFDENQQEILMLAQLERDAVFRIRLRTTALRVRTPAVRVPRAFADSGAALDVAAGWDAGRLWLSVNEGRTVARVLTLSPNLGWAMLLPYDYAIGPEVHLLTALWVAGLLLPLGYWAPAAGGRRATGGIAVGVALALVAMPRAAGLPPLHWSEWAAAAGGLTAGLALSRGAITAAAAAPRGRRRAAGSAC